MNEATWAALNNYQIMATPANKHFIMFAEPTSTQNIQPERFLQTNEFVQGFEEALRNIHRQEQMKTNSHLSSTVLPASAANNSNEVRRLSNGSASSVQPQPVSAGVALGCVSSLSDNMLPTVVLTASQPQRNMQQPMPPMTANVSFINTTASTSVVSPDLTNLDFVSLSDDFAFLPSVVENAVMAGSMGSVSGSGSGDDTQDDGKMEKKRQKNRAAARKCREKKLKKISDLEMSVQEMRSKNGQLSKEVQHLQQQIAAARQRIAQHGQYGCIIPHP